MFILLIAAPTPPPRELLIQLRILSLICSLWNVRCPANSTVDNCMKVILGVMLTDFIILICPNYLGYAYVLLPTCIVRYLMRFKWFYVPLRVSSHGSGCVAFVKMPSYHGNCGAHLICFIHI